MVKHMPDRYAAMSPFEFFAQLFAWYYDAKSKNASKERRITAFPTSLGPA